MAHYRVYLKTRTYAPRQTSIPCATGSSAVFLPTLYKFFFKELFFTLSCQLFSKLAPFSPAPPVLMNYFSSKLKDPYLVLKTFTSKGVIIFFAKLLK